MSSILTIEERLLALRLALAERRVILATLCLRNAPKPQQRAFEHVIVKARKSPLSKDSRDNITEIIERWPPVTEHLHIAGLFQ